MALTELPEITKMLAEMVKNLRDIHGILDSDRGIAIAVINRTDHVLKMIDYGHNHGGWAEPPDDTVPPQKASLFSVRDKGFMTGVEGTALYDIGDTEHDFYLRWVNPFAGSNEARCSALQYIKSDNPFIKQYYPQGLPAKSDLFEREAKTGVGHVASFKYELWNVGA